jgi:YHS domain-containing protein
MPATPLRHGLFRSLLAFVLFFTALSAWAGGPYNTTEEGEDKRLMLKGHDPVAYFTQEKHVLGNPAIKAEHDGVTYRFASEENKAAFVKEPAKYAPQYGGFCTNGIVYGIPWGGDPDAWKIIDGKLYIFGGESSRKYFLMDEARNLKLAMQYWNDEVAGSNAFVQRYKRLILRVPHYKSGKTLAEEYDARQRGGGVGQPAGS